MKCVHMIVHGRVQGVFFRQNTRNKAVGLGLTGYVKNLEDGAVEVVAQGPEERINELVEFMRKGPGSAKVTDVRIKEKNLERFKKFEIMH